MKKPFILFVLVSGCLSVFSQNNTDISLKWKDSDKQESEISSETGNLYSKLSHHGPAVENEWLALRVYFDHKVAIDVYNKSQTRLELAAAGWYPTPEQQKEGWGADQYKVGSTVGLGGVRLWDGEKPVYLDPVKKRTARVVKEANISYMEMLSEGVPYKGDSVDILVRVTVFSGHREARVEAFALCDKPVQFLTGINYHKDTQTAQGDNFISIWGIHPEDVAAFQLAIGAGIIYNSIDYEQIIKSDKEFQLVSKPAKYLATWITSASEKDPVYNSMEKFRDYLERFK